MRTKIVFLLAWVMCACGGNPSSSASEQAMDSLAQNEVGASDSVAIPSAHNDSIASTETPEEPAAKESKDKKPQQKDQAGKTAFIVISKLHQNLTVYDVKDGDTLQLAQYPACMGKNLGNKEKPGDMRTPESPKGKPFYISQIQDAHTWKHDFGDGRGSILSYGHWFLRLNTPGHSGIGIHGSTNNESSVPGRASEGCIRLRDADIIDLKERFAYLKMPVIIKAENEE